MGCRGEEHFVSVLLLHRYGISVRSGRNTFIGVLRGQQWVQSGPWCSEERGDDVDPTVMSSEEVVVEVAQQW